MARYRNQNTGDEHETDGPSLRLEALPNWVRLDPESEPSPGDAGSDSSPAGVGQEETTSAGAASEVPADPTGDPDEEDPAADVPPAATASKADWVDYAVTFKGAAREQAERLTKANLANLYGGQ